MGVNMPLAKWALTLLIASAIALSMAPAQAQPRDSSTGKAAPRPTVPTLVADAYFFGDFAELERLYAIYGKPGVRSDLTGVTRLGHFWMGIRQIHFPEMKVTNGYYLQLDALTSKWALEHPQSVLAQLLHARALIAHAWSARGSGYSNTVSPEASAGFVKYLGLAEAQLRRSEALAEKDSSWNLMMMDVGLGLGWDKGRLLSLFEAGVAKNPDHDELYLDMQTALLPKWGGSLEMLDRFIAYAVKATREQRGLEMYARLYAGLSYEELHQELFTSGRASWTSMKAGFEDLLKRHPHVDHRNMYAYFACMADDRQVLQEQLELIGDEFVSDFWGSYAERTFENCKNKVQQL
jgi:hypothetical protein